MIRMYGYMICDLTSLFLTNIENHADLPKQLSCAASSSNSSKMSTFSRLKSRRTEDTLEQDLLTCELALAGQTKPYNHVPELAYGTRDGIAFSLLPRKQTVSYSFL